MKNNEPRKVITGNQAAAYAAMLAKVQFIAVYPITPQTTIVEYLANFCCNREDVVFERVESEHSAMAACVGASAMGLRTFTATSSHGLALMHEMLHWAAGGRFPVVMVNANRALGMPWNIHADQTDSLSQRDTNWIQFYCSSNQEVLDTVLQAFALAETVNLPVMVCLDGFLLTHTAEPVIIPDRKLADKFLPARKPLFQLDVDNPYSIGSFCLQDRYMEIRKDIEKASFSALKTIKKINRRFRKIFGRSYGIIEKYRVCDAETVVVTNGTVVFTAKKAIGALRKQGIKAGLINLRVVRPFPAKELLKALKNCRNIAVIDRSFTANQGGILAQEIKSATMRNCHSCIAGLGGRDLETGDIEKIVRDLNKGKLRNIKWVGLKKWI